MSKQTEFINKIAPIIQRYAKQYGFKTCSGIIAQACLESAWGASDKAAYHNYFGLKYRNGRVGCHIGYFKSGSKEEYKVGQITNIIGSWYMFASMDKGVEGYFQFICNGPYPTALLKEADNPRSYLSLLKESKYATSSTYVENNMRVVKQYNLTQFDREEAPCMKINVHGGHNKKCPGAHGYFDETTEDRKVKDAVIKYLRQAGHTVYDCTDDDGVTANANLRNIVNKCNAHDVDYDISIHFNASAGGKGHGAETWVWSLDHSKNGPGLECGQRIVKRLAALGFTNRGVKDGHNLYVVRKTIAPAVLVEVCFCDNSADNTLYKKLGPDRIGKAIAAGILGNDISDPKPKSKQIKATKDAVIFEPTGSMKAGEVTDYVDETSEFYILHGNRFVRKENFDVL